MGETRLHILLIEDEDDHAELIRRAFEAADDGVHLQTVATLAAAGSFLEAGSQLPLPDLIIADWRLPDGESLEFIAELMQRHEVPVVMMTSHGDERVAVEAIRCGILDYVVKSDLSLREMPQIVSRALRQWQHVVERRRTEVALRESEWRYRLITERATDTIFLLDHSGSFVYLSPSVQRTLGYAQVALIGATLFDYVHPQELEALADFWQQLRVQGQAQLTYRYQHADGSWRWLDTQGSIFAQDDETYAVLVGRDITERRRLEEQLMQSQKLEAIGKLAGGVAHDFNNLLVVIIGCAELAMLGLPADSPVHTDLEEILKASRRASGLTRQLLTFARRQVSEPQLLDLNSLILDLEKMLQRLIREDIHLQTRPASGLWPVWVDPGQIEQVIVNLVVNARDAMPDGGQVTIATENVQLAAQNVVLNGTLSPGDYVLLAVTDTGRGMSAEVRRQAFEPFFTTKAPGQGTGLGLATCYGIIKQHHGAIAIDSEVGQDTRVRIYLPRAQATNEATILLPEAEASWRGGETVLLVEDDPAVRTLTAKMLRAQGYEVLDVENGTAALALIDSSADPAIDLLLTDLVMPRLGGLELIEQLQQRRPAVRVLLMSGHIDSPVLMNGLTEHGIAWLQKPFTTSTLLSKVRAVLDGRETARV